MSSQVLRLIGLFCDFKSLGTGSLGFGALRVLEPKLDLARGRMKLQLSFGRCLLQAFVGTSCLRCVCLVKALCISGCYRALCLGWFDLRLDSFA